VLSQFEHHGIGPTGISSVSIKLKASQEFQGTKTLENGISMMLFC
jgi:hypothetical protein